MPINKKLIHFKTKENFLSSNGTNGATTPTNGYYGNIPENSIVFIKDTKEIWTHGLFYDGKPEEEFVDLGLPSGTLWCTHNVGATRPEDYGLYFSWGNVTGHTGTDGYDFGTSNDGPYASTPGAALTGNIPTNSTYDAARHNMGAPCRMPTVSEFQELDAQCDSEWTDEDGVYGRRFTSRINGNSIFFPASGFHYGTDLIDRGSGGYYWSASLDSQTYGYDLGFSSAEVYPASGSDRFNGFSVRAVKDGTPNKTLDDYLQELNLVKGEDDLLYQIHPENGDVTPLLHPDLSTQPSILPQRFGKYDIKEVLVPIKNSSPSQNYAGIEDGKLVLPFCDLVPKNSQIIEASVFGDGVLSPATIIKDSLWNIFVNIPLGNYKDKLNYILLRYTSPKNNYYYYNINSEENKEGALLASGGGNLLIYSTHYPFENGRFGYEYDTSIPANPYENGMEDNIIVVSKDNLQIVKVIGINHNYEDIYNSTYSLGYTNSNLYTMYIGVFAYIEAALKYYYTCQTIKQIGAGPTYEITFDS